MLGRSLHSTYGPTADTGGLAQNGARVLYAYPDAESILEGEAIGGGKSTLPGPGPKPPTERPRRRVAAVRRESAALGFSLTAAGGRRV
jgi:hypothetical protein